MYLIDYMLFVFPPVGVLAAPVLLFGLPSERFSLRQRLVIAACSAAIGILSFLLAGDMIQRM